MMTVRTIWPTFVDDFAKPRLFAAVWQGEHLPDFGSAKRALPGRVFDTRAEAQAVADRYNGAPRD